MNDHFPFELVPLPYDYQALEPFIDSETMEIHHDRHLKTYVDNLNKALKDYPRYHQWNLEELLININRLPIQIRTAVKNNGGGVYNHNLYFSTLGDTNNEPTEKLKRLIEASFGSYDQFKTSLKEAGLAVFGSGWAWLAADSTGRLKIISTANQDTLLQTRLQPILPLDVWEHAYYLKHQNRRADYIDDWLHVIDWRVVEDNLIFRQIR